jgi:hypothetical protein
VSPESPLERIVGELDAHGIQYMAAGSLASTYHGEPRTTRDMDLVVVASKAALDTEEGFPVGRGRSADSARSRRRFLVDSRLRPPDNAPVCRRRAKRLRSSRLMGRIQVCPISPVAPKLH